ncbi:hypothetical protein CSUB01_05263 [Colletotrichum sublineola]|uniref:Uncharacterized protein n=1 Tax=Colletotrichum sublineola TaxID=1173701 RepID=A0A066X5N9_COLSU|nr:hypothetical protein CSUB01_05263 [Colletotrichum sublineola]
MPTHFDLCPGDLDIQLVTSHVLLKAARLQGDCGLCGGPPDTSSAPRTPSCLSRGTFGARTAVFRFTPNIEKVKTDQSSTMCVFTPWKWAEGEKVALAGTTSQKGLVEVPKLQGGPAVGFPKISQASVMQHAIPFRESAIRLPG